MACTDSMMDAVQSILSSQDEHNNSLLHTTPFAGGIAAFCVHMAGEDRRAEYIAHTAMAKGFDDPWTIHAVAQALTSQGKHEECAAWLQEWRPKFHPCHAFMKGHVEFHMALCFIYLKDATALWNLIQGGLWATMPRDVQADYWNAAGLLNILWKAEMRGNILSEPQQQQDKDESLSLYQAYIQQALVYVVHAPISKSNVFSLCIFRFLPDGPQRDQWHKTLTATTTAFARGDKETQSANNKDNTNNNHKFMSAQDILARVARAISLIYHLEKKMDEKKVKAMVLPMADQLHLLEASPEQRETIQDVVDWLVKMD
eukprot:scaffold574_cov190-Amphora_coffeaeformis.AAC.12